MIGNGGFGEVFIQDQDTRPINTYFLESLANFSIAADTGVSTITSLLYEITLVGGHGLLIGDEILLLDTVNNRELYAVVKNVNVDVITIDRPIDNNFIVANTLGRKVSSKMNVDGSSTKKIFTVRAGTVPIDFAFFGVSMSDNSIMDETKFGSLTELNNGLVLRIVNSYQESIFTFKKNADFSLYGMSEYPEKVPAGTYAFLSKLNFNGQENRGVVLRVSDNDVIQFIVQDNLSTLDDFRCVAVGHLTEGEI